MQVSQGDLKIIPYHFAPLQHKVIVISVYQIVIQEGKIYANTEIQRLAGIMAPHCTLMIQWGYASGHFSRYVYLDRSTRQEIDYSFPLQIIHRISSMPGM